MSSLQKPPHTCHGRSSFPSIGIHPCMPRRNAIPRTARASLGQTHGAWFLENKLKQLTLEIEKIEGIKMPKIVYVDLSKY